MLTGSDPRDAHKPLQGPLQGFYRITYGRYRAVYTVEEEEIGGGKVVLHLKVIFIAAGIRKEHDKNDVYRIALKLAKAFLDSDDPVDPHQEPPVKKKKRRD